MVNSKNNNSGKKTFGVSFVTRFAIFSVFVGTLNTFTFSNNGDCSNRQVTVGSMSSAQYNRCLAEKGEPSASFAYGKTSKDESSKKKKHSKKSSKKSEYPSEDEAPCPNFGQEINEEEIEHLGNIFQELSEKVNVADYLKQHEGQMEEFAKKFEEGDEESLKMEVCINLFENLTDSLIEAYAKDTSEEKKMKMKKNAQKTTNKLLKYCLKEQKKHNKNKEKEKEKEKRSKK
ncbi:hypothetical protein C922_03196 [Plasmodium inui San Antonio 1]|uniref:Uncharacterized protein n=1 Tax=Plasmodium inui San Antonio 1 TaxID=1237626 RepID=W7A3Q6_9APIC|nr:hypothetical protein C922_03196 [Plasmodium inui San Antonio 1]EUD66280.1 hypothetical protein C922_03196 [Plasmodium inui San Antonio 1]